MSERGLKGQKLVLTLRNGKCLCGVQVPFYRTAFELVKKGAQAEIPSVSAEPAAWVHMLLALLGPPWLLAAGLLLFVL